MFVYFSAGESTEKCRKIRARLQQKTAPGLTPGLFNWQEWRGSNPQPPVWRPVLYQLSYLYGTLLRHFVYLTTDDTTPAPTVRPPSRIAKRKPSSIAIGAIKVTVIAILSPGISISTYAGNSTNLLHLWSGNRTVDDSSRKMVYDDHPHPWSKHKPRT